MFTFCKARWARQKKKRKENHATKVTKIPKTKRQKYGMNKTLVNTFQIIENFKKHLMIKARKLLQKVFCSTVKYVCLFLISRLLSSMDQFLLLNFSTQLPVLYLRLGIIYILRKHLQGGRGGQKWPIFAYFQYLQHALVGGKGSKNPKNVIS